MEAIDNGPEELYPKVEESNVGVSLRRLKDHLQIIDSIIATGINALDPLEPIANMDMERVKEKYGHRVALIGNIDCGQLLPLASNEAR